MTNSRAVLTFCLIGLGVGWPLLSWPLLADCGLLPPAPPLPVLVLVVTYGVLVPTALVLTWLVEGGAGVRRLLVRIVRWRFGPSWWFVILAALPVVSVLVGLLLGGSLHAASIGAVAADLMTFATALLLIHLAEELVWAGFVQTRLGDRFGRYRAAAITALPFAGIHLPLVLASSSPAGAVPAVAGLVLLAVLLRTAIGLVLTEMAGSVLAAAVLHASFNTANNDGALLDRALDGIDQGLTAVLALTVLTLALAVRRWSRPARRTRIEPPRVHATTGESS